MKSNLFFSIALIGWCGFAGALRAQENSIQLRVDATEAPRQILRAKLVIPVKAGPLTLLYPKWLPGEHGPTGPITDLTGLKFSAQGAPIQWERDPLDLYAVNLDVPAHASSIEVSLDFLLPPQGDGFTGGASATERLVVLNWNQVVLYPKGKSARELTYRPELKLPASWKFGSALSVENESGNSIRFSSVTLEQLVDSPLIAGAHLRTIELNPGAGVSHKLHLAADSEAAVAMPPEFQAGLARLVAETGALFGDRPYRKYHFLLAMSDHIAHFGLEHHESSDNRTPERMLLEEELRNDWAGLLPHEIVHAWNGKYRRPADMITTDFHQPIKTDMLWVYEGLTTYLGELLTVRSGLWSTELFRDAVALTAARLDHQAGRNWRPLSDTAIAAQLLFPSRTDGRAWRRGVDFYAEGWLIWLEADVVIRQQTSGRRSLNDFCKKFFGGSGGTPKVVPYTFTDLVSALNEIAEYDWTNFFRTRIYNVAPHAPLGGISGSGWRMVYNDQRSKYVKLLESTQKIADASFSIGLTIKEDGTIQDVIPGMPAHVAGVGPGTKLLGVNGRRWSPEILRDAIQAAKNTGHLELLIENSGYFKNYKLNYKDGERYPNLEKDNSKPDLLSEILSPLSK